MYINHFHTVLGEKCPVGIIDALRQDQELYQLFYSDGFRFFLKDESDVLSLISNLLTSYLKNIPIEPEEITAVFLVTDNNDILNHDHNLHHSGFVSFRNSFFDILSSAGINKSSPYIIGGGGCASLSSAIRLAQSIIGNQFNANVLVLFVEKFDCDFKRIMPLVKTNRLAAGTIGSDMSAGLIISNTPKGRKCLKINDYFDQAHLSMISAYKDLVNQGNQSKYVLETIKGLMSFKKAAEIKFKRPLNTFNKVYAGNYTSTYFKIYNRQFGWIEGMVDMTTKSETAHAQSLDSLMSIFECQSSILDGLIFLIGPCMWSAITFDYLEVKETVLIT